MLLTVQELAQQLHIKAATLYAWAAQGKIPSLKLHGLLRFRQDEIDQWLESCERTSRPRGNQTEIKPHRERGT
jgi:excisionase family DNA binding protein